MKVACVGGGPAGLYLSILLKLRDPSHEVTVYERDPAGSTYGWGVTYWRGLLDKLHEHDPESARAVADASVSWNDGVARVGDSETRHPGDEGFGIGRHKFLDILADRARQLGVRLEFEHGITDADDKALAGADLVVAADGVNSALREQHTEHFGAHLRAGRNRYIWLGTTKVFDAFTFDFKETEHGWIWCYGYGYSPDNSTCVVECAPETWSGLGLDRADEADGLALLEKFFGDLLDGHPLIGRAAADGAAQWLNFRTLTNRTWRRGNLVLLGDAAHTTHYSIGAGTTLALEDAIALADALHAHPELPAALAAYEERRTSELLSIQSAARYSAQWYENLPRYIRLPPARMFALLGQRHSPLLPYVPPQLYYGIDRAAGRLESLRRFKRWLGPKLARTAQTRVLASRTREDAEVSGK
ncbi:FAD-dependent monooxygenase [Streptomyces turgidiscabies]|uniref:Putative salicylyl-CoA 5-hydroxylase n=1 Tax=Streptomyces turgidiscabies (strain Car8) TaxID=698760 RepID=L7EVH5_STRT8|nr:MULTISPECIES: FAD-dependent monooxygenase [Streptomyces]ELP63418.1 putative salicylyl-CoA 5-hydroxylase [Streptomyces turgidiscabies Car8]MDX3491989.1 FAD-dependent monooxygenase [Streptomyces turgidiscabies]GAQ71894.1 putative tryptophan hydroxylase VioD [Streptomyces turgidiscabies]